MQKSALKSVNVQRTGKSILQMFAFSFFEGSHICRFLPILRPSTVSRSHFRHPKTKAFALIISHLYLQMVTSRSASNEKAADSHDGLSAADVKRNNYLTASSSVTTRQCSSKFVIAIAVPSLDGDPDGFTLVFGFDDFLFEAVNPDAAVEDFADFAVLSYQDAAFGVF